MSRIDESIQKMQDFIDDIELTAVDKIKKVSDEGRVQVEAITLKTVDTIKNSIEKLNNMKDKVVEDQDLFDFLNRLEGKCKDVTAYTKMKINEIAPVVKENLADFKADLEKGFDNIKDSVVEEIKTNDEVKEAQDIKPEIEKEKVNEESYIDKVLTSENFKNVVEFIKETKDRAIELYNKPETQEAIDKAKVKVIEVAEKGLVALKIILDREDDKK